MVTGEFRLWNNSPYLITLQLTLLNTPSPRGLIVLPGAQKAPEAEWQWPTVFFSFYSKLNYSYIASPLKTEGPEKVPKLWRTSEPHKQINFKDVPGIMQGAPKLSLCVCGVKGAGRSLQLANGGFRLPQSFSDCERSSEWSHSPREKPEREDSCAKVTLFSLESWSLWRQLKLSLFITLKAHSGIKPSQWESWPLCSRDVISAN